MTTTAKVLSISSAAARGARERWRFARELIGGALLLAAWLALWTVTWAAVAGPLRPASAPRSEAAAAVSQA